MADHANEQYSKKPKNYTMAPPTKAAGPNSVGYDVYDIWDLGEFDQKGAVATKYGTKQELESLIKTAHEHGINTYIDAVLNHRFGADKTEKFAATEVDNNDREKEVSDKYDIKGWTGFTFKGRNGKYSKFKYNFNHFSGVDYNSEGGRTAIFKIHGDGKDWAQGVDDENANYDYLMGADIDYSHPEARDDTIEWGKWIMDSFEGVAGFRFDAVKHIDSKFIGAFVDQVRKQSKKGSLFAVGEFWKDSTESLDNYLNSLGTQFSVFDTPLHYKFKEAGDAGHDYDLRKIFDDTVVQMRPIDAVTIVDNHDTQVGQSLESWVSPVFKPLAYALILLRVDGYPCVFWGDLYGCAGPKDNAPQPMKQLGDFIRARKLFAYGELRDYWDHPSCLGWVRMGDEEHDGCAVVICNGSADGVKRMEVGSGADLLQEHKGEKWTDVLGWYDGEIEVGQDGWAEFKCHSQSVSIWTKTDARGRNEFKRG
ncbi:putative alpha-amylase [Exidia glandulosa HHB12029]|uniref:Putative alpha-amylase n=1 Tax=Exidia glandulosa HHB12029 TaxID=1314781 RepID=A0A165QQX0_EXIGL|nr:putative alpha-amylase [Exidia glandulosa HHB12029]